MDPIGETRRRVRGSVLLVEDDPDYLDLLHATFAEAGFETLQAANGEKALKLLRSKKVDLVVSDFMMPELNGLELCRLMGDDAQMSRTKVILYSCNSDPGFRRKARELGALEYLAKTENTAELVEQVCDLLGIDHGPASAASGSKLEQSLDSISDRTDRLRVLLDSLLDFLQIAVLPEELPPSVRLALEAARRTGGDLKRAVTELGKEIEELKDYSAVTDRS